VVLSFRPTARSGEIEKLGHAHIPHGLSVPGSFDPSTRFTRSGRQTCSRHSKLGRQRPRFCPFDRPQRAEKSKLGHAHIPRGLSVPGSFDPSTRFTRSGRQTCSCNSKLGGQHPWFCLFDRPQGAEKSKLGHAHIPHGLSVPGSFDPSAVGGKTKTRSLQT